MVGIITFVDVNTWLASIAVFTSTSERAYVIGAIFIGTTCVCISTFVDVCAITDYSSTCVALLTGTGERLVNVTAIGQGVTVVASVCALISINTVCLGGVTLIINGEFKSGVANASGARARKARNTGGR